MNSQAVTSTDRDSLVALDALLRIRDSGALNSFISNSTSLKSPSRSELSSGNRESMATCTSSSLQAHLAARFSTLLPMNAASVLLNNANQQNAVLAAAQFRLAAASTWGNSLLAAGNGHSLSNGVSPSLSSTPAGAIAGTPRPRHESFDLQSTATSPEKKVESLEPSPSIRKEKVAEALRSKPQRGRKRDDLSETERLELTRTRNREHAKSTRIRKKARYQELLDREELYLQQQEQEDIEDEKRNRIHKFLSLRQDMLRDQVQRQARNQQIGESSSSCRPSSLDGTFYETVPHEHFRLALAEIIDPTTSFEFESLLPGDANADSDEAISKMQEWDEALVDRARCTFTNSFSNVPLINYEIESGSDGIALNKNGDAFCRVDIFVQAPNPCDSDASGSVVGKKNKIMSGICSFQFGSKNNLLTSMRWTTLEDRCSAGRAEDRNRPFPEYLQSQLVHPSVVSLDHVKQSEGDDSNGPGMNI